MIENHRQLKATQEQIQRLERALNQTTQDWHSEGSPRGHCERSEAISARARPRLLRRAAPRNDR